MKENNIRILIVAALIITGLVYFGFRDYFTLAQLKSQQQFITAYQAAHPQLSIAFYTLIYVVITGFSLPGATLLTLAGGALFGLFWGTVIVSFASTIGAVLAFLAARFLFREHLEQHFGEILTRVNKGIEEEGGYYLFTLRLIPLFPFFVVNLVMGLTQIKTSTFFWISQLGMLPGTLLYVNAGTQLANIKSLSDIGSPLLIGSFVILGIFPLAAKKIIEHIRHDQTAF